jgi:distribution and morphology protein 12
MSFELDWDQIREPSALDSLKKVINAKLARIDTGGLLQGLLLEEIILGEAPPDLIIEDIEDVSPAFLAHCSTEEEPAQIVIRIRHSGPILLSFRGSFVSDYPAAEFLSLPIRIQIRAIRINGLFLLARLGDSTFLSLRRDADTELAFTLDSEIGDATRHSLKNVGKVEAFIQNLIHKVTDLILVYPNYLTLS